MTHHTPKVVSSLSFNNKLVNMFVGVVDKLLGELWGHYRVYLTPYLPTIHTGQNMMT